jgi:predicted RNA binding protein YcfA (HicA-like mRNA interferase family)
VKLSRDISGIQLAKKLERYGYRITRRTGSHLRLTSSFKGTEHHITIPQHNPLKIGTLNSILNSLAAYLETDKNTVTKDLF